MRKRPVDFSQLRILVVENHLLMRRLLRAMLQGFGVAHISEARNVPQAIEHIYSEPFDAVILDFFLGDMDGADFAWTVRHHEDCINRQVPILMITGMPDHHKVLKVRDAGINGMLAKPIAPKDLYQRLYTMLAYPRPFIITPDYVGPQRDTRKANVKARPPAALFARRPSNKTRQRKKPVDPANEDRILM